MVYHLYILKCSDGSYFIGQTDHLGKRLTQHHYQMDPSCYTATRLPVELVFQQPFATKQGVIANQQQLLSWSDEKLQAFIESETFLESDLPKERFVMYA